MIRTRFALLICLFLSLSACQRNDRAENSPAQIASGYFVPVTDKGINFQHDPGVDGTYFMPESLGSGAALLDYDNDGDLDILLLNCGEHSNAKNKRSPNKLFRQDSGFHFTDVTKVSGLSGTGYSMGVAAGDIDNDGDVDVYITNFGPDELYRNNGDGTFTDITAQAGISDSAWGTSAAFLDYDRDGYLDLFVANYVLYNPKIQCTDRAGRLDYCGPDGFRGSPDILYHNSGNNTFTDVSVQSGIARAPGKGLGIVAADFNGDHFPDIYVANDREPNFVWINNGGRTFSEQGLALGCAVNILGQPEANMGIAIGDVDSDMDLDLYLTHLHGETNTFYRNSGKLGFQDDTAISRLGGSRTFTGFGTGFFDFDHDDDLDAFVANGRVTRGTLLAKSNPPGYWDYYSEPNLLYENNGKGEFSDVSTQCGLLCSSIRNSRAATFGDIDNDGDIDILVSNEGGPAELFKNEVPNKGHWLMVRAIDPQFKRDALDARITVNTEDKKIQRVVNPFYSYLSSNDPRVHFGLGSSSKIDLIQVLWPDGTSENFSGGPADRFIVLEKGKGNSSE
jgi:enediyne biosynthesis protein E4